MFVVWVMVLVCDQSLGNWGFLFCMKAVTASLMSPLCNITLLIIAMSSMSL